VCCIWLAVTHIACMCARARTHNNSKSCGRYSDRTGIVFDCFDLSKGTNAVFIHFVLNNWLIKTGHPEVFEKWMCAWNILGMRYLWPSLLCILWFVYWCYLYYYIDNKFCIIELKFQHYCKVSKGFQKIYVFEGCTSAVLFVTVCTLHLCWQ
jgi:hypothetical protein